MKKMGFTLALIATTSLAMADQGDVRPAGFQSIDRAMPAATNTGERLLAVREIRVDVSFPGGKREIGTLLILFDPLSGYYLPLFGSQPEKYGPIAPFDHLSAVSIAYVTADRLILFSAASPSVYIHHSDQKANNLSEAEGKALAWAKARLPEMEKGLMDASVVSLHLDRDFVAGPQDSMVRPIKILGVTQQDAQWQLTIQGQFKAKATIELVDGKYKIVHFVRVEPEAK